MSSKITVYGWLPSPPVRAVILTLKALNLDYDFVEIRPGAAEKSAEYLKINPQYTIPALQDDGKCIVDSHAICTYLARKYSKDDSLYPKDFYQRALVDARLHYENGIIFMSCAKGTLRPIMSGQMTAELFEQKRQDIHAMYKMLETFLGSNTYMAGGDTMTIADLSIVSSVYTLHLVVPVFGAETPKLLDWMERMQKLPYFEEVNGKALEQMADMLKSKLDALK